MTARYKRDKKDPDKKLYEPRHGLRMSCSQCGWTFRMGGIETKKQRDQIERDQKKIHDKVHELSQQQKIRTPYQLHVEKDSHAVELPHAYVEQVTRQFTTSTTYSTVPGTTISSSSFTPGELYLFIVTAQADTGTSTAADVYLKVGVGTEQFTQSEAAIDQANSGDRWNYMWWAHRVWVSGQDLHLLMRSSTDGVQVGVDQICISAFRLTPDLTEGTHFAIRSLSPATPTTLVDNTDTTENNGWVAVTPPTANHRWLILSKARYGPGITGVTSVQSRIKRSGQATNDAPVMQQEGEDGTNDFIILCGARVDTLGTVSNTYEEISQVVPTAGPTSTVVRRNSGMFMLDLDVFRNVAVLQEDSPANASPNSSTTAFAELVATRNITTTQTGDVFALSHITQDWGGTAKRGKIRMQINNVDRPGGTNASNQTNDSYNFNAWTTEDHMPIALQTIHNLSAATHTIDVDGSLFDNTGTSPGSFTRTITAFSLELASGAAAITKVVPAESVSISEPTPVKALGGSKIRVVNESVSISEPTPIKRLSSTNQLITADSLQLRLSGGPDNIDPAASLGGDMSTVLTNTGVDYDAEDYIANDFTVTISTGGFTDTGFTSSGFTIHSQVESQIGVISTRLLDDVLSSEAIAGDPADYRCFYLINLHATMTMFGVKIWISQNTPGGDEVQLGIDDTVAINGIEQGPLANENIEPTNVTFVLPSDESTAITVGDIPAGQKKGVWIKRIVPAGIAEHEDNGYQLMVKFTTNHV